MSTHSVTSEIRKRADWAMIMGVLIAVVGVLMVLHPFATAAFTTIFLGWSLIIAAVAQLVFAFYSPSVGPFFLKLLLSIVYGIAGVALVVAFPIGVATLTMIVGSVLLVQAGLELAAAIAYRSETSWGWLLVDSILSLALGLMILFEWPWSSFWAIGTMLGVAVLMAGISRIVVAGKVHHEARKFDKLANA